jgi:hypothetical protein
MEISELAKPTGEWCPHWAKGVGCSIYESRPGECRKFVCGWLLDANLGDEWKPEKSKLVVVPEAREKIVVYPDPSMPNAWRKSPYFEQIKTWAKAGWPQRLVFVMIKRRGIVVLPDTELDIGQVPLNKTAVLSKANTPSGYEVKFL